MCDKTLFSNQQLVRLIEEFWNIYYETFPETNPNYNKFIAEEYAEENLPF